jgi:hypothetical protein
MRAPTTKLMLHVPGMRDVPTYSPIEYACRMGGQRPQGSVGRASYQKRSIAKLIRDSRGNISDADLRAIVNYLTGKFDLQPAAGRPADYERQHRLSQWAKRAREIAAAEQLTLKVAIATALKRHKIDDADGAIARGIYHYIRRGN